MASGGVNHQFTQKHVRNKYTKRNGLPYIEMGTRRAKIQDDLQGFFAAFLNKCLFLRRRFVIFNDVDLQGVLSGTALEEKVFRWNGQSLG
jgi:hypothetical protein